jgi:Na+-transporting methylmalonyl-CoA/oxaloacetate decarboxylase gamma subunit
MRDALIFAVLYGLGIFFLFLAAFIYGVGESLRSVEEKKRKLMNRD